MRSQTPGTSVLSRQKKAAHLPDPGDGRRVRDKCPWGDPVSAAFVLFFLLLRLSGALFGSGGFWRFRLCAGFRFWLWPGLGLWLPFRLGLCLRLWPRLCFWLRAGFGLWFPFRLWLRLPFRFHFRLPLRLTTGFGPRLRSRSLASGFGLGLPLRFSFRCPFRGFTSLDLRLPLGGDLRLRLWFLFGDSPGLGPGLFFRLLPA